MFETTLSVNKPSPPCCVPDGRHSATAFPAKTFSPIERSTLSFDHGCWNWMEGRALIHPSIQSKSTIHPPVPKRNSICAMSDKPSWQFRYSHTRRRRADEEQIHRRHKMRFVQARESYPKFANCHSTDRTNHNSQLMRLARCRKASVGIAQELAKISSSVFTRS